MDLLKDIAIFKISNSLLIEKVLHYVYTYPTIQKRFKNYIKKEVFSQTLTKITPKNEKMSRFTVAFS